MIKVLGLSLYGQLAASTRYRLTQYRDGLAEHGIDLDVRPLLDNRYLQASYSGGKPSILRLAGLYGARLALLLKQKDYQLIIVNAELFPLLPGWLESRLLRIPYIYDFDDAFFLKYTLPRFWPVRFLLHNKFEPVVTRAAGVLAGNRYLFDYASQLNAATQLFPTVVDTGRYRPMATERHPDFTIGWIGSPSTSIYLNLLVEPLQQLARECRFRFVVIGGSAPKMDGVNVEKLPWDEATEIDLINHFDVGVMPLFDDPWARGKCAFKLIQYMACALPVIASPVGANQDVVPASAGMLADTSSQWLAALRTLRDQPGLREQMGRAARAWIVERYSLSVNLPALVQSVRRHRAM